MDVRGVLSTYRSAQLVMLIGTILAALFVISYSVALGRPTPHHIDTAVVGDTGQEPVVVGALQGQLDGALAFHLYPSRAAAEEAMRQQIMKAALIIGPDPPLLLVSSAASAPVAALLTSAVERVGQQLAPGAPAPLHAVDVRPLPRTDPQGLIGFYVTFAATILGFSMMFNLRAHEPRLSLRAWLGCVGLLGVVGGLTLTAVATQVVGGMGGSFLEIWAAVAAQIWVTSLFTATMIILFGRWAVIPAWLLFVAIGNPSAGGSVSAPILPWLYAFFGTYLPTGATVAIVHNAAYFHDARHIRPIVVQLVWLVACFVAVPAAARAKRWRPEEEPIETR